MGQPPRDLLDRLDAGAEAFSADVTREFYLNHSGQKDDLALASIFEAHGWLFERETVESLLASPQPDPRYPELLRFVVEGYLERAAAPLTERMAERETSDSVTWDGRQVSYRSIPPVVMNEPDPDRRHALDGLRAALTAAQNPLREERWDVIYARTRDLGFPNYREMIKQIGRIDLDGLAAITDDLLWRTDGLYRRQLEEHLRRINVTPALAERSDLSYLFRSPQFDAWFAEERLLPALAATLAGLGIDLAAQPNVAVDTEPRPRKSPRAFCAPIRIPAEVVLVIRPHGGQDDYRSLFHEAGHTQHFAHTSPSLSFAERGLGDNSVTEGFAFVLEHVVYNPAWLRRHLNLDEAGDYVAFSRFHKLYMLRRYAAKLAYERDLHGRENVRSRAKRYADLLTAAVAVRHPPEDYLSDLDDAFYAARYLRAWIFEAQVRRYLEDRWGAEWFAQRTAGDLLRELWSFGQRYTAEELLGRLGFGGLDAGPLLEELEQQ